jgi:hypothetical protein
MTNEEDMIIREAARRICAEQASSDEATTLHISVELDNTIWMRLVEQGIRRGIEIGRSL